LLFRPALRTEPRVAAASDIQMRPESRNTASAGSSRSTVRPNATKSPRPSSDAEKGDAPVMPPSTTGAPADRPPPRWMPGTIHLLADLKPEPPRPLARELPPIDPFLAQADPSRRSPGYPDKVRARLRSMASQSSGPQRQPFSAASRPISLLLITVAKSARFARLIAVNRRLNDGEARAKIKFFEIPDKVLLSLRRPSTFGRPGTGCYGPQANSLEYPWIMLTRLTNGEDQYDPYKWSNRTHRATAPRSAWRR
jgi:hypothetical protein